MTNETGSAALFASVVNVTALPVVPGMLTRRTSVPLIHATKPSSTMEPMRIPPISERLVITKVFRKKMQL